MKNILEVAKLQKDNNLQQIKVWTSKNWEIQQCWIN